MVCQEKVGNCVKITKEIFSNSVLMSTNCHFCWGARDGLHLMDTVSEMSIRTVPRLVLRTQEVTLFQKVHANLLVSKAIVNDTLYLTSVSLGHGLN